MRPTLLCFVVVALAVAGAAFAGSGAAPGTILAALNSQRTANGIPGRVKENPSWSQKCARHIAYMGSTHTFSHSEDPASPAYSAAGNWAGENSVLAEGARWEIHGHDRPTLFRRATSSGHTQGVAALGNVSGHELSETLTDPNGNAWYDTSGAENADKCAWKFSGKLVAFTNGTSWKIQGNWSNNAYNSGTGYLAGTGCIDGAT